MGLEHLNYDQWLEEPYDRREKEAMEFEYKYKQLQYNYSINELLEMLSPTEQLEAHQLLIDHFTETLLNAIE